MEEKGRTPLGSSSIGSVGWAGCPHRQLLRCLWRRGLVAIRVGDMLKVEGAGNLQLPLRRGRVISGRSSAGQGLDDGFFGAGC